MLTATVERKNSNRTWLTVDLRLPSALAAGRYDKTVHFYSSSTNHNKVM